MKFIFSVLFSAFLFAGQIIPTFANEARRAKTVDDVRRAACRVGVENARGTGSIIGLDDRLNKYLVLTNYHVVTTSRQATCEFWDDSGKRSKTTGEIVWRAHDQNKPFDFALIAIDRSFVEGLNLPYVPLAGGEARILEGFAFDSAGCPRGQFVVGWDGGILNVNRTTEFTPGPYPGQSGSAIVGFIDGKPWNIGILTWLVGQEGADDSRGAFIPVANLWAALGGKQRTSEKEPWRAPETYRECPMIISPK